MSTRQLVAALPGADYFTGADCYFADCHWCGPGAATLFSVDRWRTVLVQCSCPRTPAAWALSVGLSPRVLDRADRLLSHLGQRFTDPPLCVPGEEAA